MPKNGIDIDALCAERSPIDNVFVPSGSRKPSLTGTTRKSPVRDAKASGYANVLFSAPSPETDAVNSAGADGSRAKRTVLSPRVRASVTSISSSPAAGRRAARTR